MIAVIVLGIFFVIGIIIIIITIKEKSGASEILETLGIMFVILSIVFCFSSLFMGSSIKKHNTEEKLLREKHKIELLMELDFNQQTLKDAEIYNKKVDEGNNYWCRFNIEDRYYLKIDINEWLEKKVNGE